MKKTYYLLFYKLSLFFKAISEDGLEKYKALIIINGAGIVLFSDIYIWYTIILKHFPDFQKYWLVIPVAVIVTINYNFFMSKSNELKKEYEREFRSFPKRKNTLINLSILMFLLFVIGSIIFSFYQMSLINWSQYK